MFSVFDDLVELKKMLFLLISPFIEIDREEKTKLFRKNTDFLRRIKTLDWCITLNLWWVILYYLYIMKVDVVAVVRFIKDIWMKMRVGAVMEQHSRNIYHLVQNTVQGNNI